MIIRLNADGVLKLTCAVFLASAIGFSAVGAEANSCFVSRLDGGMTVIDLSEGRHCDADVSSESGRGRPGMRFLMDVA
jgi:hypothetical protein